MLAAAHAWQGLSAEYAEAAQEVAGLLAAMCPGLWAGAAAESCAAAHAPYVAWLLQISATSAAAAAHHETAVAAYFTALATMPTLAELAANRAAHVALVATNFFGINTVPIAVNEADYARMWVQAAATMTTYQTSSAAAVASTPQPVAAPPIVAQPAASLDPGRALIKALAPILESFGINPLIRNPLVSNPLTTLISEILENFGIYWDSGAGILNGLGYEEYADATQPMWYLARGLELIGDTMQMTQNPTQALQYFLALSILDWPTHIAQLGTAITQSPLLLAAAGGVMLMPAATAGGFAGLAGLAAAPTPVAAPVPQPVPTSLDLPAAGMSTSTTSFASAPTSAPTPAPAPTATPAGSAPLTPSTAGPGFTPPYVIGPPGIGFGTGMASGASASAKRKLPEPDTDAVAANSQAANRRQARARQRKRTTERHYGDEFMDMDINVEPDLDSPGASTQGAGQLGSSGAAGLTTLTSDKFGDVSRVPLVPSSWR